MSEFIVPGYSPQANMREYKTISKANHTGRVVDSSHVECLADLTVVAANPAHEYHPGRWFEWVPGLRLECDVTRIRPNVNEGEGSTFEGNVAETKFDEAPLRVVLDYHFCDGVNVDENDEMVELVQRGLFRDDFGNFEDKLVGAVLEDIPITCNFKTILPEPGTNEPPIVFVTVDDANNIPSAALSGFVLPDGSIARGNGYNPISHLFDPVDRTVNVPGVGQLRAETQRVVEQKAKEAEVEREVSVPEPVIEEEVEIEPVELPEIKQNHIEEFTEDDVTDSMLDNLRARANLEQRSADVVAGDEILQSDYELDEVPQADMELDENEDVVQTAKDMARRTAAHTVEDYELKPPTIDHSFDSLDAYSDIEDDADYEAI